MPSPDGGQTFSLNSGYTIPAVGLGVYQAAHGDEAYEACLHALKIGYRHIDTAQIYRNEGSVGRAIKDSGVPREQIFVTTKLDVSACYRHCSELCVGSGARLATAGRAL
jgi:glycerol 2-dehydrogenase (NADP+)